MQLTRLFSLSHTFKGSAEVQLNSAPGPRFPPAFNLIAPDLSSSKQAVSMLGAKSVQLFLLFIKKKEKKKKLYNEQKSNAAAVKKAFSSATHSTIIRGQAP